MMKDKKNIDILFQNKLNDFESTPSSDLWGAIEQKLDAKKKKKVIPFWFWSGAVASVLLLFTVFVYKTNTTEGASLDKPVVVKSDANKTIEKLERQIKNSPVIKSIDTAVANSDKKQNKKENNKANSAIAGVSKMKITSKNNSKINKISNTRNEEAVANTNSSNSPLEIKLNPEPKIGLDNIENIEVAKADVPKKSKVLGNITNNKIKGKLEKGDIKSGTESLVSNIGSVNENKNVSGNITDDKIKDKLEKQNLKPGVESLASSVGSVQSTRKKWFMQPSIAVLNSNSLTKASTIDNNYNGSSSKGGNDASYGLAVGVDLSNRWTVQSGVHFQQLSYVTNQIKTKNIDDFQAVIVGDVDEIITNEGVNGFVEVPEKLVDGKVIKNNIEMSEINNIQQKFSYMELPVEVKYSTFQSNNFNTDLVVGGSALVLYKNQTSFSKNDNSVVDATTVNVSPFNFTLNLGVDLGYNINDNISVHVNPMFKKHLNTFSDKTLVFDPFQWGIYSGLKFKL